MRRSIAGLIVLLLTTCGQGGTLHYDRIPADAQGLLFVDMDELFGSRMWNALCKFQSYPPQQGAADIKLLTGGAIRSMTIYSTPGETPRAAILLETPGSDDQKSIEARLAKAKDVISFTYSGQVVYYTERGIPFIDVAAFSRGRTAEDESQTKGATTLPFSLNIGFDPGNQSRQTRGWDPFNAPLYTAFVGDDLVLVATTDLKCLAGALDVIQGHKPSLAQSDRFGIKSETKKKTIVEASGIWATFSAGASDVRQLMTPPPQQPPPGATTVPTTTRVELTPIAGRFELGRFRIWEDETNDHASITMRMSTAESAEQLKNMLLGTKAILYLSRAEQRPFLGPLEIESDGNNVMLHWTVRSEGFVELIEPYVSRQKHSDASRPADTSVPNR